MNNTLINTKECIECLIKKNNNDFLKGRRSCKACCNKKSREYKKFHKKEISEYNKKYKLDNKEKIQEYNKKYNLLNRNKIQKRHTQYLKNKRITDPKYKLNCVLRNRIKSFLFGEKRKKTKELLDCNNDFLKDWIEFQFDKKMNFENHGIYWHIDHVIPCNKFDLLITDNQKKCFNWSNLQPLEIKKNLSKKDKIQKDEILNHNIKVLKFIELKKINMNEFIFTEYNKYFIDY